MTPKATAHDGICLGCNGEGTVITIEANPLPLLLCPSCMARLIGETTGIRSAILKANSPSCGAGQIPSGGFDGRLVAGDGVAAALLKHAGIRVTSEVDLPGGES